MATRKSAEEKLKELEKKEQQIKNQKKLLQNKLRKEERAKRTRRLIQNGALAEKYFDCANIEPEEFEKLLKQVVVSSDVQEILLARKFENVEE